MNDHDSKELIADWCAYVCAIPGSAMPTWVRFLSDVPQDDFNLVSEAIDNLSQRSHHFKKNPNLGHLQREYSHLKSLAMGSVQTYRDCSLCANSGLLSMVIAMDIKKGRQVPVPFQVAVVSGKVDVVHTPCSCDRGIEITGPTFIKKGSHKSDEDRCYTKEQMIKLASKCGYSSSVEAHKYRRKCERFFQEWIKRHPKKPVDQTIGYKGDDNKQVMGFVQKVERTYEP